MINHLKTTEAIVWARAAFIKISAEYIYVNKFFMSTCFQIQPEVLIQI